jgi:hypothetical protein
MITSFRIVALTEKGERGLRNNINEFSKLPPQARLMWKALFSRLVSEKPLTLTIGVKNNALGSMLQPTDIIRKLRESMKSERLKEKIDYRIEVQEK